MPNPNSDPKQPTEATSAPAGWLTRAQVAAEAPSCSRCARRAAGCSIPPRWPS